MLVQLLDAVVVLEPVDIARRGPLEVVELRGQRHDQQGQEGGDQEQQEPGTP